MPTNLKKHPAITALGIANPPHQRAQHEAVDLVAKVLNLTPVQKRVLKSVYKATGIEQRYSVLSDYSKKSGEFEFFPNHPEEAFPTTAARMKVYKENALKLALSAIENCFTTLKEFDSAAITHLITVSCTGMYAPGLDIEIVHQLKLNSSINRTAINFMGCYGAFNALKVADAICKGEPDATVLVVCVELCSIHLQNKTDLDNMISNSIFADGAAAAIIQRNHQQQKYLNLKKFHNDLLPQTDQEMAWHIGDSGFDIVLSSYVPDMIKSGIKTFTQQLLDQHDLPPATIDFYALHPGGLKILKACEEALNITKEQNKYAYQVLRDFGNMSSATIFFVLKKLWDDMRVTDHGKNILSCAFGPGLTLESMLLDTHYV